MTTKDQVAQLIVNEAKARGHSRDECLAELSCLYQESAWDETVWDPTHTTYGIAQQDASYPNRSKGAAAQIAAFLFVALVICIVGALVEWLADNWRHRH